MARAYKKGRKSNYKFTAARAESLRKARAASAASRRRNARQRVLASETAGKTLGKKITPYSRFTRHSQTVGIHGRAGIPGTGRRVVVGAHVRLEKIGKTTLADRAIPRTTTRHGKIKTSLGQYSKEAPLRFRPRSRGGRSASV